MSESTINKSTTLPCTVPPLANLLIAAIGLLVLCLGLNLWQDEARRASFFPAQAIVTESKCVDLGWSQHTGKQYEADIAFEYQKAGGKAKGHWHFYQFHPEVGQANEVSKNWPKGRTFTIYINPNNPEEMTIVHQTSIMIYGLIITGAGLLVIFGWLFLSTYRKTKT
ncbi:MAG: hypothetical protein C5B53_05375 [Candidatus Melainabacteria bacterium]|nr:MAG: hypothetical protein C5B53_05375 [Candidatus Melainabacteria bacterium]